MLVSFGFVYPCWISLKGSKVIDGVRRKLENERTTKLVTFPAHPDLKKKFSIAFLKTFNKLTYLLIFHYSTENRTFDSACMPSNFQKCRDESEKNFTFTIYYVHIFHYSTEERAFDSSCMPSDLQYFREENVKAVT